MKDKKILIIAGEASGDLLGAQLARALLIENHDLTLVGMGSQQMQKAHVKLLVDSTSLAVVGVWEILIHLKDILKAKKKLQEYLTVEKPDLIILIDYPGFNLRMAKYAKKLGIKVLYFVSPQIWAWRYHRIHHIKKYVDHMTVLFPFEKSIYEKEKIPVTFVGHPLINVVTTTKNRSTLCKQWNLNPHQPIIGLMPGSRVSEITRLMPVIMKSVKKITQQLPDAQFILPLAPSITMEQIKPYLTQNITVIEQDTYHAISTCSAIISASGTATLEIALLKIPMVIIYKISLISYRLAKWLVKTPFIGLCNIVANQSVAKELIQDAATPEAISEEIIRLINDTPYRKDILSKFSALSTQLGDGDPAQKTAKIALSLL